MKKNVFLGIDRNKQYCCILETFLTFKQMCKNPEDIEQSDFVHGATNWCGKDDISRTLEIKKWKIKGDYLTLPEPLIFSGYDEDFGHRYSWKSEVAIIAQVEEERSSGKKLTKKRT